MNPHLPNERTERRDHAVVVTRGDGPPASDLEWACARLMWELYALPLVIDTTESSGVYVGNLYPDVGGSRPTRTGATEACARELAGDVHEGIAAAERKARTLREEAAALVAKAAGQEARAKEWQELLAPLGEVGGRDARG